MKQPWLLVISALQIVFLIALLVLEYLSEYRAGVMQHLYIYKVELLGFYENIYIHIIPIVILILLAFRQIFTAQYKNKALYFHSALLLVFLMGFFTFVIQIKTPNHWPPPTLFLLYFELAVISQAVLLFFLKRTLQKTS